MLVPSTTGLDMFCIGMKGDAGAGMGETLFAKIQCWISSAISRVGPRLNAGEWQQQPWKGPSWVDPSDVVEFTRG